MIWKEQVLIDQFGEVGKRKLKCTLFKSKKERTFLEKRERAVALITFNKKSCAIYMFGHLLNLAFFGNLFQFPGVARSRRQRDAGRLKANHVTRSNRMTLCDVTGLRMGSARSICEPFKRATRLLNQKKKSKSKTSFSQTVN